LRWPIRLDAAAQPMIEYLTVFERGANLFAGFENEIQGLYRQIEPDGRTQPWRHRSPPACHPPDIEPAPSQPF
jgi:hypothetical protein